MVLPVPFEAGECPREIYGGELALWAPRIEGPLFSVLVSLRLSCDPSRLLFVDLRRGVEDFGEWTVSNGRVVFDSDRGFGHYQVAIEPAPSGDPLGIVLTLPFNGRQYTFRRTSLPSTPPALP